MIQILFLLYPNKIRSLKLTAKAPETRPTPKKERRFFSQTNGFFRTKLAVSFREVAPWKINGWNPQNGGGWKMSFLQKTGDF